MFLEGSSLADAMLWCQCAASDNNDNLRVSFNLHKGVKFFVDNNIRPIADWYGETFNKPLRILLHLPFGRVIEDDQKLMAFNGYSVARTRKKRFVYDQFVSQYGALVDAGHEVIAYLGRPGNTTEFKQELKTKGRRDDIIRKLWDNLRLPLEAGCNIGLDNFSSNRRGGLDEALGHLILATGSKLYTEATMERLEMHEYWWDLPQVIMWSLFRRRHGENQHPGAVGRFPKYSDDDFYPNEVIVLTTGQDVKTNQRAIDLANEIDGYGCIPAFNITAFKRLVNEPIPLQE